MTKALLPLLICCALLQFGTCQAAEVINAGVGGHRSSQLLKRVDRDVLSKQPTVVVLMVGTNDRLNSGGFIDIKTYRRNVETLVDKIQAGGAKVVLMTPPTCIPELLFTRHDAKKYTDQSPVERMKEVRQVLLEIARAKQIPVIDFHDYLIDHKIADDSKTSVIRNPANSGIKDGVHLTPAGYQLLAKLVAEKLKAEQLDVTKVICFGDSLTKGSKNANYPAYLEELLKQ
ncbi:SGNH/GDSL hydrolase family protein [Gimesia panareensis]|uniref:SGNH/GDSL hydrolase family protein n=1 Tax=Gimesia panareensis TaxID=2527978 RepID=UPI00118BDF8B|nr:GDSL-type esterase/lipase family protein [Gimesia panareensis]QDU50632.1 multifunctional acyl-CoA thioesterase I and protease I and lysophospholipase L1 [Gimesia panareensis]